MAGPPSEASLHALVDKADAAFEKGRWARAADLSKRAALQASAMYPHDSLVIAALQCDQANALHIQSNEPDLSFAEEQAILKEEWALVRGGMEVLSRRHASDTLGHNKCRPDEVQYAARHVTSLLSGGVDAAQRARGISEIAITSGGSCFGVSVAMQLACLCLHRMHSRTFSIPLPQLAAPERGLAEQFIFLTLDCIASTRAVTLPIYGEPALMHTVQRLLASPAMEPSFRAALESRWTSPDVVASLRTRGTAEQRTALVNIANADSKAAQREDVAEHGLLVCALPGCDKQEVTVREFKVCSACRAVAYCSAEHGGLHWAGGHKNECNDLKAAGAKPARAM